MKRPDISDTLMHFTKGKTEIEAFNNLCSIVLEGCILSNKINEEEITCFTETPFEIIKEYGFVNHNDYSPYKPFGLIFKKKELYQHGARPACYIDIKDIKKIPETLRWVFTPYKPSFEKSNYKKGYPDFLWEREWRMKESLEFRDLVIDTKIIVKNEHYKNKLIQFIVEGLDKCECLNPQYKEESEMIYEDGEWKAIYIEKENDEHFYMCTKFLEGLEFEIIYLKKETS